MSETERTEATNKVLGDFQAMGEAARRTTEQARQAGADAVSAARDVAHEARDRAASVADTLGQQASSVAEAQKGNLADTLEDVAKAVHRSGEQLEGHQDWVAHLVERGAAELQSLATTLRNNDLRGLMDDLGSLARRQPALFVGASMAAGFALTRIGRLAASGTPASTPTSAATAATTTAPTPTSTASAAASSQFGAARPLEGSGAP